MVNLENVERFLGRFMTLLWYGFFCDLTLYHIIRVLTTFEHSVGEGENAANQHFPLYLNICSTKFNIHVTRILLMQILLDWTGLKIFVWQGISFYCKISYSVLKIIFTEPRSSVGSVADLRKGVHRPIFFPRIDDSHCDRIHSCLTDVRCFDNGYVVKQPVAWKEYCGKRTPGKHG